MQINETILTNEELIQVYKQKLNKLIELCNDLINVSKGKKGHLDISDIKRIKNTLNEIIIENIEPLEKELFRLTGE